MNTGVIILAAGASSRLGQPKQTLPYLQTTLLGNAIQAATKTNLPDIVVVLGANSEQIVSTISGEPVTILINKDWEKGMSTSVRSGLNALLQKAPQLEAVIIMLCDQPFVSSALLNHLIITKYQSGKGIVASAYNHTLGAPVLFGKSYFENLLSLQGDEGAKKLLYQYKDDVASVDFPQGNIDIDTKNDYESISKH